MKLINLENEQTVSEQVGQAYSFYKRLIGLMFTKSLDSGCALHIEPCRSIHTFFMNYSIDVLYLSEGYEVVGIEEHIRPGKVGKIYAQARSVVELPAGSIQKANIRVGHKLQFKN